MPVALWECDEQGRKKFVKEIPALENGIISTERGKEYLLTLVSVGASGDEEESWEKTGAVLERISLAMTVKWEGWNFKDPLPYQVTANTCEGFTDAWTEEELEFRSEANQRIAS
jgi:hypothetical protein